MKNTFKLLLLLLLTSLFSCKKYIPVILDPANIPRTDTTIKVTTPLLPTPPAVVDDSLVGKWAGIQDPNGGHTVEEGPVQETLVFAADGTYKSTIVTSYLSEFFTKLDSGTYSVGHGNYAPYSYDSIAYYHKDSIVRVNYYQIIADTLNFNTAFKGGTDGQTAIYQRSTGTIQIYHF
jgi:hypothetical protein